jgi:NAD-dependent dihydropyrimidine dehydrogenase PreA subunit/DNA-binding Lrp family transcriptional regulator
MNKGWPLQLPKRKKVMDYLKIVFNLEEAQIISIFNYPFVDLKSIEDISKLTNISVEKVAEICQKMAKKGVILKIGEYFGLLPILPGLFEFYFISGNDSEENLKKAAKLLHELLEDGLMDEWYNSEYPFFRLLPDSSIQEKTKTVDVNESIPVQHEILVYEDVEKYINLANRITLVKCTCRTIEAYLGNKCEKPVDVCIAVNIASEAIEACGKGKDITKEEALEIIKMAEDHGLVHTIVNASGPDAPMLICSCCTCHCAILRGLTKFNNPRAFAKSNFRPEIDRELCKLCKKCVEICPMKAMWHHMPHKEDLSDNFIEIKEHLCIGCGLCAHHCPEDAIAMNKVYDDVPETTLFGIFRKIDETRVH